MKKESKLQGSDLFIVDNSDQDWKERINTIEYNRSFARNVKDIRKHIEKPFNLLKHREGLEPVRVRSKWGFQLNFN